MPDFRIGLLFSTTGPYAALGRSARDGAVMALEEVNRSGRINLVADIADPCGIPGEYERLAGEMVTSGAINHIVGGITSWSRKDMIPVLERHGGMLWYPCPYEGFETSDHVVYLGACPNQHLLPILDHVADRLPRKAFLVGSNYVWGWETLRISRQHLVTKGIEVSGERYLPLGEIAIDHLMAEIAAYRPDVIVNSLIGPSNHAFMQALAALQPEPHKAERQEAETEARDSVVVSANQTEADLDALGPAAEGMISIAAWFETVADVATAELRARVAARYGVGYRASCNFATAYAAVHLLAGGLEAAGRDDARAVFDAVAGIEHDTVLGRIAIDPVSRHTALIPRLATVRGGAFEIVADPGISLAPDPYLSRVTARPFTQDRKHTHTPNLRIVS